MIIKIEALDTLFFRDGKPFSMGDDTWANGIFPPLPSVLYGAIRSAYLGQNDIPLDEIEEATSKLRIKNIWYRIKAVERNRQTSQSSYFPQPLDLVHEVDLTKKQKYHANKHKSYDVYKTTAKEIDFSSHLEKTNVKSVLIYDKNTPIESGESNLLDSSSFKNYLKGQTQFEARQMINHYHSEPKTGIRRNNNTHTTEEGNLYRIGLLRTETIKICIEFEGIELDINGGLLKLGGENKIARYTCLDSTLHQTDYTINSLGLSKLKEFKICLTSPSIFRNGYYPVDIFTKAGVKVELTTCIVGKSIHIGGFDMQKRQPKKMAKAVPAGSVYYYKLLKGNIIDLENAIQKYSISESRAQEGFGIAYLAK